VSYQWHMTGAGIGVTWMAQRTGTFRPQSNMPTNGTVGTNYETKGRKIKRKGTSNETDIII